MPTLVNSFDGGTSGQTVTPSNSGGASGDGFNDVVIGLGSSCTYSTTHSANGTQSARLVLAASDEVELTWTELGTQTTVYSRMYLWFDSNPGDSVRVFFLQSGTTTAAAVELSASGKVRLKDAGNVLQGLSTSSIATGQLIRLECKVVHSVTAGIVEAKLFNTASSGTPTETITATGINTLASSDSHSFGRTSGIGTNPVGTFYLDAIELNNTGYPGPLGSTGNQVAGGAIAMSGTGTTTAVPRLLIVAKITSGGTGDTFGDTFSDTFGEEPTGGFTGTGTFLTSGGVSGGGELDYDNTQAYNTAVAYQGATTRDVFGPPVAMSGVGSLSAFAGTAGEQFIDASAETANASLFSASPTLVVSGVVSGGAVAMSASGTLIARPTGGALVGAKATLSGVSSLSAVGRVVKGIIIPDIPPVFAILPDYRVVVSDLNDAKLDELPFAELQFSYTLNEPGTIEFGLPLRHSKVTPTNLVPGARKIRVIRGGRVVWGGYLWAAQASSSAGQVRCSGQGWFSRLQRRYIDTDLLYDNVDQRQIAWNLINYTQTKSNGNLGITRGDPADDRVRRTRRFRGYERANIGDEIQALTELEDGFDFTIETDPNTEQPVWIAFYPRKGTDTGMVFEVGTNVGDISYDLSAEQMTTRLTGLGAGTGRTRCLAVITDGPARAAYGLLEDAEEFGNIKHYATMFARTKEELRKRKDLLAQPQLVVQTNNPPFDSYDVGDYAFVKANLGFLNINKSLRIVSMNVGVSQQGKETVSLFFDEILIPVVAE